VDTLSRLQFCNSMWCLCMHVCLQVYELLNLTPDASAYIEHNGSLDILRPAVVHIRQHQQGRGVIAVSPRCV